MVLELTALLDLRNGWNWEKANFTRSYMFTPALKVVLLNAVALKTLSRLI